MGVLRKVPPVDVMAACHARSSDNNFGSSSAGINRIKFVGFGYLAISALACTPERVEVYGPRAAAVKRLVCLLANPGRRAPMC